MDHKGLPPDDPLRISPPDESDQLLESVVDSWPTPGLSEHLSLEVAAASARGRPLDPGVFVPGCACEPCTGLCSEAPEWTRRTPLYARKMQGRASWEARVDQARGVPLIDVVQRLGFGTPVRRGREFAVHCPLHEDSDPSLKLNLEKQVWYCHPCGIGGDALQLLMRVRRIEFAEAVRELAA